jgi:hypothetical protein
MAAVTHFVAFFSANAAGIHCGRGIRLTMRQTLLCKGATLFRIGVRSDS